MQCVKVIFLLIPCVFSRSWTVVNLSSITIRQAGNERVAFEVTYSNMGKNQSEFSGYFTTGEERTINIPQGATNIQINTCYTENRPCKDEYYDPFMKLWQLPTSCVTLYGQNGLVTVQAKCKPRPAEGYSITVNQVGDYKSLFELNYSYNDSVETRSSGEISNGQSKTVAIPDGATHIRLTLYGYNESMSSKKEIFSESFETPVKKCFESRNHFFGDGWSKFEKVCPNLPAGTNNSISVRQTSDSKIQIVVHYFNIDEFVDMWESSDEFSKGEKRSIRIPNESTNIRVILRWRDSKGAIKTNQIARYNSPVIKCFEARISSGSNNWSEESCHEHSIQ